MRKLLLLCAAGTVALLCLQADAASTVYGGEVVSVPDAMAPWAWRKLH